MVMGGIGWIYGATGWYDTSITVLQTVLEHFVGAAGVVAPVSEFVWTHVDLWERVPHGELSGQHVGHGVHGSTLHVVHGWRTGHGGVTPEVLRLVIPGQ